MLTGQALDIVLKLAKFGDSIAQVKGLNGKRLSDIERTSHDEAIKEVEFLLTQFEDTGDYAEDDYMED
tara:strand:- start:20 stop:223 length:204 start_codon:yes stop_codon:yes gene_type:complete